MAYTQEDLTAVNAQILKLATGKSPSSITEPDGRSTTLQTLTLSELQKLKSDILSELNTVGAPTLRTYAKEAR